MVDVAADRLQLGQIFPNKKTVSLHFAEAVIQVSIFFWIKWLYHHHCKRQKLSMQCRQDYQSWLGSEGMICKCSCERIYCQQKKKKLQKECSPVRVKWMIDLLVEHIRFTPNLSNQTMCKFIQGYATDCAITDNLLQKTHSEGKDAVFGNPTLTVRYCCVLKTEMEKEGHRVHFLFAGP